MSVALKNFESFAEIRTARAVQGEIQHRLEPQDRLSHVPSCLEAAATFGTARESQNAGRERERRCPSS